MHVIESNNQMREEIEDKIDELESIETSLNEIIAICTDGDKVNMYKEILFENREELCEMEERLKEYERNDF